MRRGIRAAAVLAAATLALAACGSDDEESPAASPSNGASKPAAAVELKIGMAYDVGGRGDQSFNDAAAAGLDKAKAELGAESQEVEAVTGEAESAREERLTQLAEGGYNPVIAVGFVYATSLAKVAPQFPDTHFAIIDSTDATGENIANLVFAEEQGSFLVGAAAALKSESGNIGFVGGVNTPLINKFEAGYRAGAEAAKPGIKVQSQYLTQPPDFSGFGDPAKGKTAAQGMFDAGADVVYQAAGGSGGGVFEAAKAAGGKAVGVDSDQALTADASVRDVILTSMLKKVDVAVYDFLQSVAQDQFTAGTVSFDLAQGGVDYSTTGNQVDDIKAQLDEYKQQIIDGEITVPTTLS
ncbi:BMP family lipoprotein [Motilibacter aurantiacus]|uniref:BMP family lipoprotein n=1 Tax=Motilibacter aurantiacus TaxID=2714955 RepID=UPI00140D4738|nr:BMP family ABC transporter substrate-binding protein [Motilibacter aurantiacus]